MKNRALLNILFFCSIILSCNSSKDYKVAWDLNTEGVKKYSIGNEFVVLDTIGSAPINEKISVYDRQGKLLGWAGTTSESSVYQIVRYIFDDSNQELNGFLLTYVDEEEVQTEDYEEKIVGVKNLVIKRILDDSDNGTYATWFDFKRKDGCIVGVFDHTSDTLSIKAGDGNHIEYEVEENDQFWNDDFFGGSIVLLFHIVPNNTNAGNYTINTYCGYELQMKSTFKDGLLCERIVYMNVDGNTWCAKGQMRQNGNEHTYKFIDSVMCPWEYTYENGVLKHRDYVSQYGTVLEQDIYFLSQDNKAYIHFHKEYDYKRKILVKTEEERIDKKTFLSENSEEEVLKMASDLWEGWRGLEFSNSLIANGNN